MLFCFAAIAWKSHIQAVVATSLTEAEFYSSVTCGKIAKYLCYVLTALDALRPGPTRLFIDNIAALHMINEKRPTPRARHIDIHVEDRTNGNQVLITSINDVSVCI